ncbi:uncharacterized protein LOC116019623 [Ipomoea triloba]|uniref:uncharacterized protein LOC116019623 n=1 Tax=Ipomoea triloba TaxID=35885 RepID=UPI00125DD056|nr:uncharacterized protein LOC116019623 [Ipomoea triloba]
MKDPQFTLGMTFSTKNQFREAVQNYAFNNGKEIKTLKNDNLRCIVTCTHEGCPWRIGLRKVLNSSSWRILNMNDEHEGCFWVWENKMVKSTIVAKRWATELKDHPDWMMRKFKDKVCSKEGFYVSDQQAYREIWKARKLRVSNEEDNFKRIWSYCAEVERTNPRTTCLVQTIPSGDQSGHERFLRMYVCWAACKQGFKHCRGLIGVDGCHLRGVTGGMILTAVGVDANDSVFPIAYAIVEGEKRESWKWFLTLLKDDLEITPSREDEICFISDKQKGLLPAFGEVLSGVQHRFCVRHLHANMKVAAISKLRGLDEDAYQWLGDKSPTEWYRSHFSTNTRCDMLVNNICESWNSKLLDARDKPIIDCLEVIRKQLMARFYDQRQKATEWKTLICPAIVKKLKPIEKEAAGYLATQCDHFKFEVGQLYGDQQEVDLERKECSCRKWQLTGFHASTPYVQFGRNMARVQCLIMSIPVTQSKLIWKYIVELSTPWQVGRPKKLRKKSADELSQDSLKVCRKHIPLHCSVCREAGHNSRKCPSNPNKKQQQFDSSSGFGEQQQQVDSSGFGAQQQQVDISEIGETQQQFDSTKEQQQQQEELGSSSSQLKSKMGTKVKQSNRKKPYYTKSKTMFKSKYFGNKGDPIDLE